jgi:hypothetical protein
MAQPHRPSATTHIATSRAPQPSSFSTTPPGVRLCEGLLASRSCSTDCDVGLCA